MTAWRDMKGGLVEIRYAAPPAVRAVIDSLGRTEDIRFSPNGRRLAVAAFNRGRIAVFDIEVSRNASGASPRVALTGVVEIAAAEMKRPHGVDFISDEMLVVASREGHVASFMLPESAADGRSCDLSPVQMLRAGGSELLRAPGSVRVTREGTQARDVLICSNAANHVTRHGLGGPDHCEIGKGEILLKKWLDVPDSVAISPDRRWLAISNHNTHSVLLYENSPSLAPSADPDGLLRGVHYPHGLRFSRDGRHLILADAGAPYVHVYAGDAQGWRGVRNTVASFQVMDDALFRKGRSSPQDGGPKGLDIDSGMNLLAITSECQPIAFFDLAAMLDRVPVTMADPRPPVREQQALQVRCELDIAAESRAAQVWAETKAARAKAKLAAVKASLSWRLTKPLRRLQSAFRRPPR